MSLFLVYFEMGEPMPQFQMPAPLVRVPVVVEFENRAGAPRPAMAVTDGVASDRFQRYGNKVAARHGAELRRKLFEFIRQRLDAGARPCVVFVVVEGALQRVNVRVGDREQVDFSRLEDVFARLEPGRVVEVMPK